MSRKRDRAATAPPEPIRLDGHLAQRMSRALDEQAALQTLLDYHQKRMKIVSTELRATWTDIKARYNIDLKLTWEYNPYTFTITPKPVADHNESGGAS